ncbi:MAG: ABC transporter permease [Sphaerochaeta sp.]|jgi:simple sugar transport system permease protein|uniref:ABC transporter permease subunit n=1 Tax=Sphaerochaeta sp. TaxID=1972642 RepID=UPI002FCBBEDA
MKIQEVTATISGLIKSFGLPRIIIGVFLLILFILAPFVGVNVGTSLSDTLNRFGMNAVMVLAMVPMIHSGCGLNFGLPLGIIAGLLGATISLQINIPGPASFFLAILFATPFAVILGWGYGQLLNRVKGGEMMIATYVGFSSVAFMCIMWLLLPFSNPTMVWGYSGTGLRTTISTEGYYLHVLNDFLSIRLSEHLVIPTGMLIFFAFFAFIIWAFLHTKTGTAMTAVGSNPIFARASGIDVDRIRTLSVVMSTWLGAIGILVYQQSFGFIQLYMGPFYMALPAVSAILIGGASVNKASILNVIVGTFLFQGIVTMTPSVMNSMIHTDMSEVIRIVVSNGMILYALTRKTEAVR